MSAVAPVADGRIVVMIFGIAGKIKIMENCLGTGCVTIHVVLA